MKRAWRFLVFLLVTEWRMYVGLVRLLARRSDVPAGAEPVPYVGGVALLLWGFTTVSVIELVALHLVIPWEDDVRLAADVLGIWSVVWCLGLTGCHYVYPHLATADGLELRLQRHRPAVTVPWDAVGAVRVRERSVESGRALQVDDGVLAVPVDKRTTLELVLTRPLAVTVRGVTTEVHEVRVHVDESREAARTARRLMTSGAADPA